MAEEDEEPPSALNHLPRELLFDIFSRCPPKILYRLRCVCSKWLFILTFDADFISHYHRHHRLSPLLLFSRRAAAADGRSNVVSACCHRIDCGLLRFKFAVNFSGDLKSTISSHGIVCFVFDSKVLLFDPATSRASELPSSPNFAFSSSVAFGFSAISGEFKLVHLYRSEKFDNYHYSKVKELMCEILSVPNRLLGFDYSSGSCEYWRSLGKCPIDVLGRKSYVCANENIYWLVAEKSYNPDCVRILSFDLVMEDFGVVCFPRSCSNRSAECLGLLEISNKLCLTDKLPWETTMAIWELNNNLWVKKHEIDLCRFDRHDMKILGHSPAVGDGLGQLVIKMGMKGPVVYDLNKAAFHQVVRTQDEDDEDDTQLELQLFLNRRHLL